MQSVVSLTDLSGWHLLMFPCHMLGVDEWSLCLNIPKQLESLVKGVWPLCYSVGCGVVYSLFSLIFTWLCSLVQGREQTPVFRWGTRVFGLPITFMADLLCYCNSCLEEKLLPRLCVPVGCHHFPPVMGWWQPGLPELFSSNTIIFFFLIGGAVEDSGEAGVLLWVSGGVQCLHHPPGVSGPSPSLRWRWGRTKPPCLWNPLWAPKHSRNSSVFLLKT